MIIKFKLTYLLSIILVPLILVASTLLFRCGYFGTHVSLKMVSYDSLSNWQQDDQQLAFIAFKKSCTEIATRDPKRAFSKYPKGGTNADWQTICTAAKELNNPSQQTAKEFFEKWFQPYEIRNNLTTHGIFTGYYLPMLSARLEKSAKFSIPIYGVPDDLVRVNLAQFRPEFAGKTIVGQVINHTLKPYPTRADIYQGRLNHHAKIIAWSNNLVDAFFAEVQGSAVLQLQNNQLLYIGYANDNGQKYAAIGNYLVKNHDIAKKDISMQSIKTWLENHPQQVNDILIKNPSYVFFRVLKNNAPVGVEGVPLTPERSLAVDLRYIPLGAPLWVKTSIQVNETKTPFQHLLISQDTGGAIKGIIRGDIYWGAGEKAETMAGHMNNRGRYWILLPKVVR